MSQVRYNPIYRFQGGIGGKTVATCRAVQALEVSPTMPASKMNTQSLSSTFFVTQVGQEVGPG